MLLVYRMSIPAFFLPDFEVYVREVSVRPGSFSIYFSKTECICQRERLTVHAGSAHDIDLLILLAVFKASSREGNTSAPGHWVSGCVDKTILRRFGKAPLGSDSNVFRPMMIVFPVVSALKRFRSLGSQNNNLFS